MALTDRLVDAFYAADPEGQIDRLRDELAALPEPKLRQLLQEFGAQVCSEGTPEEDLLSFWEHWDLPTPKVAETTGRRARS